MKKISEAALKKAILAMEAERSKHPGVFRPDRAQRATLQKSRRALDKMVSGFLREAGLDIKQFEALQEEQSVELQRMVAKHKADALRRASRQKDTLQSSIVEQSKALQDPASRKGFFPYPTFTLSNPIVLEGDRLISDYAIVPFGTWAKFRFATSQSGTQKVGFYFVWDNPFNDYVVINAATFMSAIGYLRSDAPWGFGVSESTVYATALFNLWSGLPSAGMSSTFASAYLGGTGAFSTTFTGGDTEATSISSGVSLNTTTMFASPPNTQVFFEVALELDYDNDGGTLEADFESGDFQIACPVVVFSLLNSPPGVMA